MSMPLCLSCLIYSHLTNFHLAIDFQWIQAALSWNGKLVPAPTSTVAKAVACFKSRGFQTVDSFNIRTVTLLEPHTATLIGTPKTSRSRRWQCGHDRKFRTYPFFRCHIQKCHYWYYLTRDTISSCNRKQMNTAGRCKNETPPTSPYKH
jgi:hypothetical protein